MLRALRINGKSQDLWNEYFKLELRYWFTLKSKSEGSKEEKSVEESIDASQLPDAAESEGAQLTSVITSQSNNPIMEGALLQVIYDNAIKSTQQLYPTDISLVIPKDIQFRMQFLKHELLHSQELRHVEDAIYQSIERDFPNNTSCLRLLAERELGKVEDTHNYENAFNVFERSLQVTR